MFERLKSRYVGRHDWPSVTASVCSTEFHAGTRNSPAHLDVLYTFWIEGHIYEGEFQAPADSDYDPGSWKKDDAVEVLYCPSDPNISVNPDFDFVYQHGLPSVFAIGGVVIAIVLGLFMLNK